MPHSHAGARSTPSIWFHSSAPGGVFVNGRLVERPDEQPNVEAA
jgi:hypothetical protein